MYFYSLAYICSFLSPHPISIVLSLIIFLHLVSFFAPHSIFNSSPSPLLYFNFSLSTPVTLYFYPLGLHPACLNSEPDKKETGIIRGASPAVPSFEDVLVLGVTHKAGSVVPPVLALSRRACGQMTPLLEIKWCKSSLKQTRKNVPTKRQMMRRLEIVMLKITENWYECFCRERFKKLQT